MTSPLIPSNRGVLASAILLYRRYSRSYAMRLFSLSGSEPQEGQPILGAGSSVDSRHLPMKWRSTQEFLSTVEAKGSSDSDIRSLCFKGSLIELLDGELQDDECCLIAQDSQLYRSTRSRATLNWSMRGCAAMPHVALDAGTTRPMMSFLPQLLSDDYERTLHAASSRVYPEPGDFVPFVCRDTATWGVLLIKASLGGNTFDTLCIYAYHSTTTTCEAMSADVWAYCEITTDSGMFLSGSAQIGLLSLDARA